MKPKLTSFKKLMGDHKIALFTPDNPSLDAHNPSESRKNGESCMGKVVERFLEKLERIGVRGFGSWESTARL